MCEGAAPLGRAIPQSQARSGQRQSYQNVSRETFWYDQGQKPYKPEDSGLSVNL
jgi:hypothetical protein